MTLEQIQLLELTKAGIWNYTPDPELFDNTPNWSEILNLAQQQTLLGVIFPAIEKLPPNAKPQRNTILKLHQIISLNRQLYNKHLEVYKNICTVLQNNGATTPILLKGLGVSQNYPDPTLRQIGDIDLYIGPDNFNQIWSKVRHELNISIDPHVCYHHVDFQFLNTQIEVHKTPTSKSSVAFNAQKFMEWCKTELSSNQTVTLNINGYQIITPPADFNFIYIFYHTWRHFLMGGVGLRQLSDWATFIDKNADKLNYDKILSLIQLFKLQKPIALFAAIAVKYLGLNPNKLPKLVEIPENIVDSAMERIWVGGNFGFHNKEAKRRNKPFIVRKLMASTALIRDAVYLTKVDKRYSLRFYRKYMCSSFPTAAKQLFRKTK